MFGQELNGYVTDTLNNPLQNANVIAFPKQHDDNTPVFSISDEKGRYRLLLKPKVTYEVNVSYLGFALQTFVYESTKGVTIHNFRLVPSTETLDDVEVTYQRPITFQKDTTTYLVEAFTTGKERKLEEQLQKLPNVEVNSQGNITFKGKNVSTLLIEDKPFFSGSTTLGVKNIPADAVDKIQFIENYNQVSFLKDVTDNKEIAINIKLRKNKKEFIFGDLQAGYGNADYGLLHAALFSYSPDFSANYIGDYNNFGSHVFSKEDARRFQGGMSAFIENPHRKDNLVEFTTENNNVIKNESLLNAFNVNLILNSKFNISAYAIVHKNTIEEKRNYFYNYLETNILENRQQQKQFRNNLAMFNFELNFTPKIGTKWKYNIHSNITESKDISDLLSNYYNLSQNIYFPQKKFDIDLKQYLERHQSHHAKLKTTFVVNHSFERKYIDNQWLSNKPMMNDLLPISVDNSYDISSIERTDNQLFNLLYKQYRIIDNRNHVYFSIGNNLSTASHQLHSFQSLTNGSTNDFTSSVFTNSVDYLLNDSFFNVEYKLKIGKWINRFSNKIRFYQLENKSLIGNVSFNKWAYEPEVNSEYDFNSSETVEGNYKLTNELPSFNNLTEHYTLKDFNMLFKGNGLLRNEEYHIFNLMYYKSNIYKNYFLTSLFNYTQKNNPISYDMVQQNVNQFYSPIQMKTPEKMWFFNLMANKKISVFRFLISSSFRGFYYNRNINTKSSNISHNVQSINLIIKTLSLKNYEFNVGYSHQFNQFKSNFSDSFQRQSLQIQTKISAVKNCTLDIAYKWHNLIKTNAKNQYNDLKVSVLYRKEKSPLGVEVKIHNLLDAKVNYQKTTSDYLISEQEISVLPRLFLISLIYDI
ncbi:carboxypeptidase-like regulatory domain-containing protein [Capnocytophaga sp. H4358]|uniref:TonB-dependent receptor n=1 Tax=Capnocytophaga sp. H4358 TaxID=1945658 RepID=UPI0021015794|nr:carboxypeptidase-like regulatory domain-containing protein [Capnocytophaga sp. H4358]